MPELKLDFKNLGAIRLMPLDTSSLFLPFGRPIADYVQGLAGNQNGTRALLKQGSIEFLARIRWTESTSRMLRTTGLGEMEREGIVESAAASAVVAAEPPDPSVADFLSFEFPRAAAKDSNQVKMSPAIAPEDLPISKPRIAALPLRPRMTFGPPPAVKTKLAPVTAPAPRPVAAPPAAKAAPAVVAPPKPSPAPAVKPAAPAAPVKVSAPAPIQPKPVTVIPAAPKPSIVPAAATRVALPQTTSTVASVPAARVPEAAPAPMPRPVAAPVGPKINTPPPPAAASPATTPKPAAEQSKPVPAPIAVTSPRIQPLTVTMPDSAVAAPPPAAKAPATPAKPANPIIISPKPSAPPMPAGRGPSMASPMETGEVVYRETPREKEQAAPRQAPVAERSLGSTFEPHLSMGAEAESGSFLTKIPLAVKIGIAILLLIVAGYFVFGKSESATSGGNSHAVAVGEQGWSTEWASDAAGSRRGRQLTLYRPSVGMSDYQFQFVGQIESKALGWIFRETDTKNYYGMKIENIRPGAMAITHFAVVEGRESSNSQKPVGIDARPGAAYRVRLDVTGPRFTLYIGGEPVDFWTDNRLKTGSVGFMNERDERGATSSVQFSFAQGAK
jgi:hypothetical protein